ncbi:hypothetical protein FM110_13000 [Brachybacterium nesterenkovii]|uniref:Uncharacterized protein n=1 Tax=Brachybacterium nesterenkovii TaxID=47847 RepID=A0A1X6X8N1_9MICO|nr:hypothetical protein FM110_13000 [Brachybacterium nesterenkovii]
MFQGADTEALRRTAGRMGQEAMRLDELVASLLATIDAVA